MKQEWERITNRNGWGIYRMIVDGKGKWKGIKNGVEKAITYNQALGYEPIDAEEELRMRLGKILLGGVM